MAMATLGIIGTGRIGRVHAENIVRHLPTARLKAVADIDNASATNLAERLGISKVYSTYTELLADDEIDAVIICSSTDTHCEIIQAAARAGKHIFCEKPIDLNLSQIDACLKAVQTAGVKLQIGFNRRFDPNFLKVKEAITSGAIGQLHIVRITSRDPGPPPLAYVKVSGGLFMDMTIHDFDMARYLADSEVKSVYAVGACRVDPEIASAGDIDTAVITLEFHNGVLATIDNSRQAVYGYDQRVEVFGSKAMAITENNTANRTIIADAGGVHSSLPLNFFMQRYTESYLAEVSAFVKAVTQNLDTPVNGADGRAPVVIALAAKRSLQEHRPILLSEIAQPETVAH